MYRYAFFNLFYKKWYYSCLLNKLIMKNNFYLSSSNISLSPSNMSLRHMYDSDKQPFA